MLRGRRIAVELDRLLHEGWFTCSATWMRSDQLSDAFNFGNGRNSMAR
jgi:hypothetical protein